MEPSASLESTLDAQDVLAKKAKLSRIVVHHPTLDLDTFAALYSGHTKINRLIFIGERSSQYAAEAFRLAAQLLRNSSLDTKTYQSVLMELNEVYAAQRRPSEGGDTEWMMVAQKTAHVKGEKLEADLRKYKSNCSKESIRMALNDLGDHYYNCGELPGALKCYSRTRDYCSTPMNIIDMCLKVIKISIEMCNFAHVHSYVAKAETIGDLPLDQTSKNIIKAKLHSASAIAYLEGEQYRRVARLLMDTPFELSDHFNDVIAANDVAVYGGLCALATFERSELKTKVIDNPAFKQFLELEPHVREILHSFYNSKYSTCMELLERHMPDFLLDIHLNSHAERLYSDIRKKALVQYFSPYSSVDMRKVAGAFSLSMAELERELCSLISQGTISARIDSHNKILKAKKVDTKSQVLTKSVEAGQMFQTSAAHMLLRMNMVQKGFIVKS